MPESQTRTTASRTQVITEPQPVLHLRHAEGAQQQQSASKKKPRVRWTQDVVDNEHMDRKKSKICCIFHPQREFGESSDEGSSSSSDSSDSSGDEADPGRSPEPHNHESGELHHGCTHRHKKKRRAKPSTPNAYETQPQYANQSKLPADAI